ncbi:MAG: DNA mismatch repair endonuclease MutL [Coprobacillaceae bacterium]
MQKIKQLDEILSNKIAAGEVVERPASVVKELVENSIDANATKIEVIIEDGGLQLIQVVDNGDGMEKEDALLCFSRHATSKIKDDSDLFCIQTLGFRGEAIPSIAAISTFSLKTSTGKQGTIVKYQYGKHMDTASTDNKKGTNIKVEKLFQNVPARLKYVKSVNTEFANIQTYIERLSLSHPHIAFILIHNDKTIYKTNGNGNLLEVISNMYGLQVAKNMIAVNFHDDEFSVAGFISKIDITRASKNNIITMVNHRVVRNQVSIDCINSAYRRYLADKRFPIAIINIEIDPYLVDVNVHPSKLEVRFSKEGKLKELISNGIAEALANINLTYQVDNDATRNTFKPDLMQETFDLNYDAPIINDTIVKETVNNETNNTEEQAEPPIVKEEEETYNVNDDIIPDVQVIEEPPKIEPREKLMKKKIFVKGQVHGTYIICEDDTGMYLVDQHAAQERINYEYFLEKYSQLDLTMQDLLVPITLEYPMSEYLIIEENKDALQKVGVNLENFGDTGYVIKQLPLWMKNIDEHIFIDNMMDQILQGTKVDVVKLQEHAIATLSCKASLKANTHLSTEGMQNIIDNLMRCDNPYVCPHGRPTIIYYSTYEIEKLFKRIV